MVQSAINGQTKVLGLIGNPVQHTLSPLIHNTIAAKLGDAYCYLPFGVAADRLSDAVRGAHALRILGLNVTVPYKKTVIPYLAGLDGGAAVVGAVNTLAHTEDGYIGYNTDVIGIAQTLRYADVYLSGKNAVVFGAGGGACAAVVALCQSGAAEVLIINRTLATAEALAEQMRGHYRTKIDCATYESVARVRQCAAVIQTTTLGFGSQADRSPVADDAVLDHQPFVLDIIYTPWETVLMKQARARGCKVVNGFDMLFFQAVAAYEIWSGRHLEAAFVTALKVELSEFFRHSENEDGNTKQKGHNQGGSLHGA